MKLAHLIAGHKNPLQIKHLVDLLDDGSDLILIHIDARAPAALHEEIGLLASDRANVLTLTPRTIMWAGWSLASLILDGIDLLCDDKFDWDYLINLSGQDLPIRPISELRSHLEASRGKCLLDSRDVEQLPPKLRRVVRRRRHWLALEWAGRARRVPIPIAPLVTPYARHYGSQWCMLARPFCEWVASSPVAKRIAGRVRLTYIPDEFLTQSLIEASPFAGALDPDHRRYIRFDGAPNPHTLTMSDLDDILNSGAFFARKFDLEVDADVMDAITKHIGADVA